MSDEPPEPLVPAECSLLGMSYMPVDVFRLFDSAFYIQANGDEFRAAFTLWGRAFFQIPAGSLPDDDAVLAKLSGAGRRWPRVRKMALRGFVKCLDGRLYHPVVCEKAMKAWEARSAQRERTEPAREARLAKAQTSAELGVKSRLTKDIWQITQSYLRVISEFGMPNPLKSAETPFCDRDPKLSEGKLREQEREDLNLSLSGSPPVCARVAKSVPTDDGAAAIDTARIDACTAREAQLLIRKVVRGMDMRTARPALTIVSNRPVPDDTLDAVLSRLQGRVA